MNQFLGFANDQLERMTGKRGRAKKGQRPEIEEKFGYDVKAAMHTIRLLYECRELVQSANITLPRPERDLLVRVRTGKYPIDKVVEMAHALSEECKDAETTSPLQVRADHSAVSKLIAGCYLQTWEE